MPSTPAPSEDPLSAALQALKLNVKVHPHHYTQHFPDPTGGNKDVTERWEIDETPLGSGGYGTVQKVSETGGARRTRAVKIVKKEGLVLRELEGLAILSAYERHFTRFYGWWQHPLEKPAKIYIFMECMEGGNLQKFIRRPVTEYKAVEIARQILQGIAIMHSRHIIHRDLKPGNILLANPSGQDLDVRIADLGSCKNLADSEARTRGSGTVGYTAPEVLFALGRIDPTKHYDIKADMWSFGCLMYAVLIGHSPYPTDPLVPKHTDLAATLSTDHQQALGVKRVSDLGIEFITELLQVDPTKRPTAKVALTHRWLL